LRYFALSTSKTIGFLNPVCFVKEAGFLRVTSSE
jgi:hypothetical protein